MSEKNPSEKDKSFSKKISSLTLADVKANCEKNAYYFLPFIMCVVDYAAIVSAESLAYGMRKYWLPIANPDFHIPHMYLFVIVPTIFLCFLHVYGAHDRSMPFWKVAKNVFEAMFYSILMILMLMYFAKVSEVVSRLFVGMTWIFGFVLILSGRYFLKRYLNKHNLLQIPVLFVGAGLTAELVLRCFNRDSGFGYRVVGFIDDNPVSDKLTEDFKILGGFNDIERVIKETGVQHVIITAPGLISGRLLDMVNRVQPFVKNISFVPDFIGMPVGNIEVESLINENIMMINVKNNLASVYNRALKRVFDIVVSSVGLIFALPLGLILAAAVYIDSPGGPVIFAHLRIGQGKKVFPCYKFRTMVPHAEQILRDYLLEHPEANNEWRDTFKLKNDPRVTRVGRFLRRSSLDELPQLLNVLKGDMSLVGPRPIVRMEIAKYGEYFHDFCLVPPGITGMWQVNGRSNTTYEERVRMDSWYVRNWSVWIDLIYLVKTFAVVIKREGAY